MTSVIRRPETRQPDASGGSLLQHEHFQICHVTNDMERAMAAYRDRFGITRFQPLEGDLQEGGHIHIELAWAGGVMYELLTASGPGSEPFMHVLPRRDAFALRLHHLGYLVRDRAAWDALETEIARSGGTIHAYSDVPGFMRFNIVEMPGFEHFLEFILPEPAGVAFFESVPVN